MLALNSLVVEDDPEHAILRLYLSVRITGTHTLARLVYVVLGTDSGKSSMPDKHSPAAPRPALGLSSAGAQQVDEGSSELTNGFLRLISWDGDQGRLIPKLSSNFKLT